MFCLHLGAKVSEQASKEGQGEGVREGRAGTHTVVHCTLNKCVLFTVFTQCTCDMCVLSVHTEAKVSEGRAGAHTDTSCVIPTERLGERGGGLSVILS